MGKQTSNSTQFSKPHVSTKGGYDKPTKVVKSQSYDSKGKKVTDSGEHYHEGSVIYKVAEWFFGKWFYWVALHPVLIYNNYMKANFNEIKEFFYSRGIEPVVRKWEYDLTEDELKKLDFQKWFCVYEFDKLKESFSNSELKNKFRYETGLLPADFFGNIYRDELIEILNFPEVKNHWPWNECLKKSDRVSEDDCEWLRNANNQEIAEELSELDDELLLELKKKIEKKRFEKEEKY